MSEKAIVIIDYTNWRGVRAKRRICPISITFCPQGTEFHETPGWYLQARDLEKDAERDFAMKDIHSWEPAPLSAGRMANG